MTRHATRADVFLFKKKKKKKTIFLNIVFILKILLQYYISCGHVDCSFVDIVFFTLWIGLGKIHHAGIVRISETIPVGCCGEGADMKETASSSSAPAVGTVVLRRRQRQVRRRRRRNCIPDDIVKNAELTAAISQLPANYTFEVRKTVWKIREMGAKRVALQFPEGLLMFACILADIFKQFTGARVIIMSDVTFGACCVDDYSARALHCDLLVHYGHSCLVPIDVTRANSCGRTLKAMYVFVGIAIDVEHLIGCIKATFVDPSTRMVLLGTVQFADAVYRAQKSLDGAYEHGVGISQAKPLSKGEVLGCTAPTIDPDVEVMVFVADGRFHLESAMIANPRVRAYRYDPYAKAITIEKYDTAGMMKVRRSIVASAASATRWGIVLGTLGRQGNPKILHRIRELMHSKGHSSFLLLLSEIFPSKMTLFDSEVDAWVQIACPRLSIDWGEMFTKPVLSTYEAFVALGQAEWQKIYPQDYYAKGSGPWTNYYT